MTIILDLADFWIEVIRFNTGTITAGNDATDTLDSTGLLRRGGHYMGHSISGGPDSNSRAVVFHFIRNSDGQDPVLGDVIPSSGAGYTINCANVRAVDATNVTWVLVLFMRK